MTVALSACPVHPSAFPAAVTSVTFHSVPTSGISEANSTSRLWVSSVTIFKESFGFEVLTAVTPCRSDRSEHFRGRLILLDSGFCLLLLFFLGLLFEPEDGDDMFLRNVVPCTNYVAL
jgi:hypothetical protein